LLRAADRRIVPFDERSAASRSKRQNVEANNEHAGLSENRNKGMELISRLQPVSVSYLYMWVP
jgi:hypothetical protein